MGLTAIFANPIAGRGLGRSIAGRVAARLARAGLAVQVVLDRPDDADLSELPPGEIDAVIAIGGDGTLRSVARRMLRHTTPAEPPPILIVPMGTANLMGQHLGIGWDAEHLEDELFEVLQARRVVHLDAACANGELFLLMAGVGLDGSVVHELDRIRSGPISLLTYVVPAALTLAQYDYPPLTVTVDGQVVFDRQPGVAFVGNIKEYGTGFPLLPHARPDDAMLDVCCLPCRTRSEAITHFLRTASGEHLLGEGVRYLKGRSVRIDAPRPVPVQVDGEAAGFTPVELDLLPVRMPFIVPAGKMTR